MSARYSPPRNFSRRSRRGRHRLSQKGVILAGGLVLLLVGTGVFAFNSIGDKMATEPLLTSSVAAQHGVGLNILVLGSDSRNLSEDEYGDDDGTQRSDSMLLVHLGEGESHISAVQIPRDTLTDAPECSRQTPGSTIMINTALNSGPACSVQAVENLTGLPIAHFVLVDFDDFANVIDAIGGLPVHLDKAMKDPSAHLDLPAGDQVLDGRQALAWARARHSIGDGSDISRLAHQQDVIDAISERVRDQKLLTRPDRLARSVDAIAGSLTVDDGLGNSAALASLANRVSHVDREETTIITMPWEPAPEDANRVIASAEADEVFAALQKDERVE